MSEESAELARSGGESALPSPSEMASVLAQSSDLIAIVDPSGRLTYLNAAGRRLLGVDPDTDLQSISLTDHFVDPSVFEAAVLPALARRGSWADKLTLVSAAGREVRTASNMRHVPRSGSGRESIAWIARDRSTEDAIVERLKTVAFKDDLTGLASPRMLHERIDMRLQVAPNTGAPMGLCFVSLDRFTAKNDRYGRHVGDALLKQVGLRLESIAEVPESAGRWAGDQFVLVFEDAEALADEMGLGQRVLAVFERPFTLDEHVVFVSASVGVAVTRTGDTTTDQLIREAEAAAQMAKASGGNRVQRFDEVMQARVRRQAEIEDSLRGAVERGEIELYYQPVVSLVDESIASLEALVRWHHPDWGMVSPAEFVPVAEATGLILPLGQHILSSAMEQCARWHDELAEDAPSVSINISPRQFVQEDFSEMVAEVLARTGADPAKICLEITESVLMHDLDATVTILRELKALGVQLAVDDFGTGYSSLTYLRAFPVDIIKVDQSFVAGLGRDPEDSAIVQAVVSMGNALQLRTVAEGVETAHHVIELLEIPCEYAQGFYFARPVPSDEATRLLKSGPEWRRLS